MGRYLLLTVLLFGLLFIAACSDDDSDSFDVADCTIAEDETVSSHAGCVVEFNKMVDVESFDGINVEEQGPFWFIGSSRYIFLDERGISFWYLPSRKSILFVGETTMEEPYGTGDGFVLEPGSHRLIILPGLEDVDGNSLADTFRVHFTVDESLTSFSAFPNPMIAEFATEGQIQILPQAEYTAIKIYDFNNILVRELGFPSIGIWDMKDENSSYVSTGAYRFSISTGEGTFEDGWMVITATP